MFLATLPTKLVTTASKVAPSKPPTTGTAFPRFIAPFPPNLVSRRNPTARLMATKDSRVMLLIADRQFLANPDSSLAQQFLRGISRQASKYQRLYSVIVDIVPAH